MKTLRNVFPKISQPARDGGGVGNAGSLAIISPVPVVDSACELEAVDC